MDWGGGGIEDRQLARAATIEALGFFSWNGIEDWIEEGWGLGRGRGEGNENATTKQLGIQLEI